MTGAGGDAVAGAIKSLATLSVALELAMTNYSRGPSNTFGDFEFTSNATVTDNATATNGTASGNFNLLSHLQGILTAANTGVTTPNVNNLYIQGPPNIGVNETVTNDAAIFVDSVNAVNTSGGSVTNAYGMYVKAPTGATNNYAATFMNRNVGIGHCSSGRNFRCRRRNGGSQH